MKFRFALGLLLIVSSPGFAAKPQIQWNESYDFASVRSFAWKPATGESLERTDPFLHEHIINTIQFYLSDGGLTEVQSDPDVIVTYYGATQTELRLQSDTYGYGWGGYGGPGWGYYGYPGIGPVSTTTRAVEYSRGTLVVDIVSAADNQLVWRGAVNEIVISDNPKKMQKNVTKAIERMVKQSQKLREAD